jgi:hypothetical protein
MTTRNVTVVAAAVAVGALLVVAAPSLFARGGGGNGRGGDPGSGTDLNGDGGGANVGNTTSGAYGGIGTAPTDKGIGPDGDGRRDGAEQEAIARDVVDGRARTDFRGLRDDMNRRTAEPRGGARR